MTLLEWVHLAARQWLLCVIGAAASACLAVAAAGSDPVYWSDATVRLVPPTQPDASNILISSNEGLISLAGVLALEANRGSRPRQLASDTVSIVDVGVTEGRLIRQPNSGGQWATNFAESAVNIQTASRTPALAEDLMSHTLAELEGILTKVQDRYEVPAQHRVTLQVAQDPTLRTSVGSRSRSTGAALALGALATGGMVMWVDQIQLRRRRFIPLG